MNLNFINPFYYGKFLRDVGKFILRPEKQLILQKSFGEKIIDLFVLLIITLTLALSVFFTNFYFFHPIPTSGLSDLIRKLGPVYFFLFSVFLVPCIEETMYRLPLKYAASFLSFSFLFFGFKWLSFAFHVKMYDLSIYPLQRIGLSVMASLLFYLLVSRPKINPALQKFWSNLFRWIFWILNLAFAWLHIYNYRAYPAAPFLMPVLTFPQLILGLSASYMRMSYGFIYAFLLHALYNSSFFWLPF